MHMHHHPTSALPCACTTLRKAARAVSRIYDEALAPSGVNAAQLAILRSAGRAGGSGIPLSRLAEQLVLDRTSLYRALQPLARRGLVAIESGANGRAKIAFLTEDGCRTAGAAAPLWEAAQARLVGQFGNNRWSGLVPELAELTELAAEVAR